MRFLYIPILLLFIIGNFEYSVNAQDTLDCGGFRTQTQGGWGAPANGDNPGVYRDAHFDDAFPNGLTIGCDSLQLSFSSAASIEGYLPCGGTPAILSESLDDPDCISNVFSAQLLALSLSLGFDANDSSFGSSSTNLGDLIINEGDFSGMSVEEFVTIANDVFGACSNDYSANTISDVLTSINENFVDGNSDNGFLDCPGDVCDDNTAPELVYGPANLFIQCGDSIPFEDALFADQDGDSLSILFSEEIILDSCLMHIIRFWIAADSCLGIATHTQNIWLYDSIAPLLSDYPIDLVIEDESQIPDAPIITAIDSCDGEVGVVFTESESSEPGNECILSTPDVPGPDMALGIIFNDPNAFDLYEIIDGNFEEFNDSTGMTALFSAQFEKYDEVGSGWNTIVYLNNGKNWEDWYDGGNGGSYKDDYGFATDGIYEDWTYYIIADSSTLIGYGIYEGYELSLSHAPANHYYGFQVGESANCATEGHGFSGWFDYTGTFTDPSTGEVSDISGNGDFAIVEECCEETQLLRTWEANDCSGNSVSHTQSISFCTYSPEQIYSAPTIDKGMIMIIIYPNPTQNEVSLNIESKVETTIYVDILSLDGKVLQTIYTGPIKERSPVTIQNMSLELTQGMYILRVISAEEVTSEMLFVR